MKLSVGHRDVLRVLEMNRPKNCLTDVSRGSRLLSKQTDRFRLGIGASHGVPELVVTNLPSLGQHE